MKTVNNLQLIGVIFIVIGGVIFFALSPKLSFFERALSYIAVLMVSGLIGIAIYKLQNRMTDTNIWIQPVKQKVGRTILITVICSFLFLLLIIGYLVAYG